MNNSSRFVKDFVTEICSDNHQFSFLDSGLVKSLSLDFAVPVTPVLDSKMAQDRINVKGNKRKPPTRSGRKQMLDGNDNLQSSQPPKQVWCLDLLTYETSFRESYFLSQFQISETRYNTRTVSIFGHPRTVYGQFFSENDDSSRSTIGISLIRNLRSSNINVIRANLKLL